MKILNKIFVVFCFSFLFLISNVYAATNFTSTSITALDNYLSRGHVISDFQKLIEDSYDFSTIITSDNYYIYFDNGGSSNVIRFYILQSDDNINLSLRSFSSGLNLTLNKPTNSWIMYTCSGTFNSNFDTISITCTNSGSPIWWTLNYDTYNSIFLFSNLDYIHLSGSYDISIDNQTIYNPGDDIPLSYFGGTTYSYQPRDLFSAPPNPNKCISYDVGSQIGIVRNVKSISFRVHDTSSALDYPIEGYFRMVSPQFNDLLIPISDYLNVSVQAGDLNQGNYSFNYNMYWVNESGDTINDLVTPKFGIYFDYTLIAEDDVNTYLDIIVTISIKDTIPAGNITFFDNPVNIYANIYNCNLDLISYGYVDNNNNYTSSDSNLLNFLQDSSLGDISSLSNTGILGDGPVDSILLLPLNIMQNLLSVLNSNTCQPLVLPLPHLNRNINLPCINTLYSQINGLSNFLNWFSTILSAFILYEYFIGLYKWVDNLLTFRENNHFGGF